LTNNKMSDDLRTVASFNTPIEADIARNHLEAAGIQAFLADDQTIGWLWHLGTALQGVKLLVAESDLARAIETLQQTEALPAAEAPPAESWTCPKCNAHVDAEMVVCWSCGTTADGVEDAGFVPAGVPAPLEQKDRARRERPPGPLLAVVVAFCIPVAILNAIVGIDAFLYYAMIPSMAVWLMVLVTCEMLVVIGLFQWWYYQPPSERVQIPDDRAEPAQETTGVVQETAAVVAARRACLAAVLGMGFCPPLLNFYSLWLIRKHKLYSGELPGLEKGLVYIAILINALVCFAVLLLVLLAGGLAVR